MSKKFQVCFKHFQSFRNVLLCPVMSVQLLFLVKFIFLKLNHVFNFLDF